MPYSAPGPFLGAQTASAYQVSRSLRFRSSASAYLSRTPSGTGSQTKWTMSFWVKRGSLSSSQIFVSAGTSGVFYLQFQANDTLRVRGATVDINTTAVFRDPSAWYSVVIVWDSANATQANRLIVYVNGISQALTTVAGVALNETSEWNSTSAHNIGRYSFNGTLYFDGYLTEFNFVNNAALLATDFGAFDTNGVWQPARYTGSYGTNGFYLPFSDNSALTTASNAGIGKDFSGNSNYWVTNNISITSGTTYDSMIDSPTNYADGGNGRGNYPTLNPNFRWSSTSTYSFNNGNLNMSASAGNGAGSSSTIGMTSGKWYAEFTATIANLACGVWGNGSAPIPQNAFPAYYWDIGASSSGAAIALEKTSGTASGTMGNLTTGDIIGVAVDLDNTTIYFYKNNSLVQTVTGMTFTGPLFFTATQWSSGNASDITVNFGQRPFTYTPPSGFSALNTQNLPNPTIAAGNKYFDATTYTGNGTSQSITNNGSFQPDLVWIKPRVAAGTSHVLTDAVRGVSKFLSSNGTSAESSVPGFQLTAFNSNGFTLVDNANGDYGVNGASGGTYSGTPPNFIAWQWNAGGAPTTDNVAGAGNVPTAGSVKIDGSNSTEVLAGSIAATRISANRSAGFSVIKYGPGTGANATVAHGLNATPSMIIIKGTNLASWDWAVYHSSLGNTQYLALNTTAAAATSSTFWYNTSPTSSVFSIGTAAQVNASTYTFVAYCFAPVAGYSAFGSYTGNGSADGPFVYCGFRPRFLLIKRTDTAADWVIVDTSRNTYNLVTQELYPDLSNAESASTNFDILSNGFKLRGFAGYVGASGGTYIYAAFAENPFKYSRAR